jgi:cell shape-determining protein MreC
MSASLRRFLILAVVAVVLFFVISQPEGAADVVRSIISLVEQALAAIATFFRSLF